MAYKYFCFLFLKNDQAIQGSKKLTKRTAIFIQKKTEGKTESMQKPQDIKTRNTNQELNQELNQYHCLHHFVHLFSSSKCIPIFFNYYLITNFHITN